MTQIALLTDPEPVIDPPGRIFLGWDRAILRTTAALLADRHDVGGELRMESARVVLPGARAGRRLKECLVEEAERRQARLYPPRVVTIGALPELLGPAALPSATAALGRRLWVRALRGLPAERLEMLYASVPERDDLVGWTRLAGTVAALHEEVAGAGLRFRQVAEHCDTGLLFADTERWSVLAEAQAAFESELARLGLSDPGLGRIDAAASPWPIAEGEIWLVGVVEMPAVVARALDRFREAGGRVRVVIHAPEDEAAGFDELGRLLPEAWSERAIPLLDEQIAVRGRASEQAAEVVDILAGLNGRYSAAEILVAFPDEELVPFLEQSLNAAGVRVHAGAGLPIERTPVLRLLTAAADFLEGRRFDAAAALLRHPDLSRALRKRWRAREGADGASRGDVDAYLEALDTFFTAVLPARMERGAIPATDRDARTVESLRRALDHESMLGRFRGQRPIGEWMPAIMELIAEVHSVAPLDTSRPADRALIEACRHLRSAALDLLTLPAEVEERGSAATAIRLLLDEINGESIPPSPHDDPVELLGWLELRLDDAPVVVITGFNEPFLPQSLNAHPFLPNSLRERVGLICNRRRYARDAYELTALIESRDVLRAIAGRRGASGDPLRPSRLMFAVPGRLLAERVRAFYSEDSAAPAARAGGKDVPPEEQGFLLPPEPVIRAERPIERISVTAFGKLLTDPYLFALERVRRLRAMDDGAREMDGLTFGALAHAVLERFGHSDEAALPDAEAGQRRLDILLDDAVRETFGAGSLPAVRLQVEQLRARLHAFAAWHAGWIASGWRIVGLECGTPVEGIPFEVDGEPIHLTGRIDRIDYHPERRAWAIFDYKAGDRGDPPEKTHRKGPKKERKWIDLQLPLYRLILPHLGELVPGAGTITEGDVRLGYINLPREPAETGAIFADWTEVELAEAVDCAAECVRLLRRNEFAFSAGVKRSFLDERLAAVMGIGYLESAAAATDEGTEDEGGEV